MSNENHKVLDFNEFKKKKKAEMKKQKIECKLKVIKIFVKEFAKALVTFPISALIVANILILLINSHIDSQFIALSCAIIVCSTLMAISETSNQLGKDIIL